MHSFIKLHPITVYIFSIFLRWMPYCHIPVRCKFLQFSSAKMAKLVYLLCLLVQCMFVPVTIGQCANGTWTYNQSLNACYHCALTKMDYTSGLAYCTRLASGSNLVSIHSSDENTFVASNTRYSFYLYYGISPLNDSIDKHLLQT